MLKAIITVGISAGGKTTFAESLVEQQGWVDINRDWIRFNVVCPGTDWRTYKFKKDQENQVTEVQKQMVRDAFAKERNVIISDTNLSPKIRNMWEVFLTEIGYEVEVKAFHITLEEAWKRDTFRANGVGRDIIYSQYQKWHEFIGRRTYSPNQDNPKAVIFDVDGTLADMRGIRSPFEWDKVGQDIPKQLVIDMAKGYDALGYTILVVSGRDGCSYDDTHQWLKDKGVPFFYLFMRKEGDTRKDTIIKEEIFWQHIADNWNVVGVVDDRPCVVRLWHELKVPNVICVGNPWVEF